jgi:hypothetical protein
VVIFTPVVSRSKKQIGFVRFNILFLFTRYKDKKAPLKAGL